MKNRFKKGKSTKNRKKKKKKFQTFPKIVYKNTLKVKLMFINRLAVKEHLNMRIMFRKR